MSGQRHFYSRPRAASQYHPTARQGKRCSASRSPAGDGPGAAGGRWLRVAGVQRGGAGEGASQWREYVEFLNTANEGPITMAYVHGWRCPEADVQKGQELRTALGVGGAMATTPPGATHGRGGEE